MNGLVIRIHRLFSFEKTLLEGSIKLRKQDPTGREIVFYHVQSGELRMVREVISRMLKQM